MDNALESYLANVISAAGGAGCPPGLAQALEYSVFPGGARIRPKICLAVASSTGEFVPELALAAAGSLELLHCASLVHDDLPCFDDATERRGKPSVHCQFGERLAVLAGDALIAKAFESLAEPAARTGQYPRLVKLLGLIGASVGAPNGICAGQAWECEDHVDLSGYHRAKTGSLFVAAVSAGAIASGGDPGPWLGLGESVGEAYQVADDIHDACRESETLGKPVGQDHRLGRPNAVLELGLDGAVARLKGLVEDGVSSIPDCAGRDGLSALIRKHASRFLPAKLRLEAA